MTKYPFRHRLNKNSSYKAITKAVLELGVELVIHDWNEARLIVYGNGVYGLTYHVRYDEVPDLLNQLLEDNGLLAVERGEE